MTTEKIFVRDVLRLLLEADSFPRQGNEDWREAERMETEALQKAEFAVKSSDDPPEFAGWLNNLRRPDIQANEQEATILAIRDYFANIAQ